MSCGVGHRHSLDPALLWLWCSPAAAAPIQPLAWEPPYAVAVALRPKKKTPKNYNWTAQLNFMFQVQNLLLPNIQPGALNGSKSLKMYLLAEKSNHYIGYLGRKSYGHMRKK